MVKMGSTGFHRCLVDQERLILITKIVNNVKYLKFTRQVYVFILYHLGVLRQYTSANTHTHVS